MKSGKSPKKHLKEQDKSKDTSEFQGEIAMVRRILNLSMLACVVGLVITMVVTCFAQVKVQETGVLLRFGKIVRPRVDPGICIKWPWPVDRLVKVETRAVHRFQAGFGADQQAIEEFERMNTPLDQIKYGSFYIPYVLTGDKNILHVMIIVTYQISDPVQYLYQFQNSVDILKNVAQDGALSRISANIVDDILTTGKLELQREIFKYVSDWTNELDLGLDVLSVELKNVRPPGKTSAAFKNVINAQEEMAEMIHEAESYQNRVIPEANAQAGVVVQEAEAYKKRTIDKASGDAGRFLLLSAEYIKNPKVTRERLRLEALENIMPGLNKYFLQSTQSNNLAHLRMVAGQRGE